MFAIATADSEWFDHIGRLPVGQRINFWKPTTRRISGLRRGDRLYFMLKAPLREIGGCGTFIRWREMTAEEAWREYGAGNGVDNKEELIFKVNSYGKKHLTDFVRTENPGIGCIELTDVKMLPCRVTAEVCGLSFPSQIPGLKYFSGNDPIEAKAVEAAHALKNFRLLV